MINHFAECRNLDKCDASAPFNIKVAADRQVVVNMIIHSADLSAQCFPTGVAKIWEVRQRETPTATEQAPRACGCAELRLAGRLIVCLVVCSSSSSRPSRCQERITREFENQAAREKAQGIEIAPFMLNLTNPLLRRQNQVNFIGQTTRAWNDERSDEAGAVYRC